MTASAQTRTQRRFDELTEKGEQVDFEDVLENITSRDHKDSTRADSPLTQARDARVLDNSNLTQSQQYTIVMDWIKDLIEQSL
jgi:cytidylate kinase